jgi:hypothetical protein
LQVIQSDKANVGPALSETEQKVSSLGSTWRLLGYRKGCRPKVLCSKPKENMRGSRNRENGERKCQPNCKLVWFFGSLSPIFGYPDIRIHLKWKCPYVQWMFAPDL